MKNGPIIIVEDDVDDKDILEEIIHTLEVPNKLIWFNNCMSAFDYLKTTIDQPFLIFSDVNMPRESGVEFKKRIDADHELRRKSIPFVFYSTSADQKTVNEAYTKMTVQGFFKKSHDYDEIMHNIKVIIDYWKICKHPNSL